MHILLELDLSLYEILFVIAGLIGVIVKIDQWVENDFQHHRKENGKLDILRLFWSYVLTFLFSGLAGTIVSISIGYLLENRDTNILIFTAIMVGAIGKLIFYKLVEWVHDKFNDNVSAKTAYKGTSQSSRKKSSSSNTDTNNRTRRR